MMATTAAMPHLLDVLLRRRSVKPQMLMDPGPSDDQIELILRAAARVPDHKKLAPWRFIVFAGAARARFGDVLAQAVLAEDVEPPSPARLDSERGRFLRAPLVIGVVSRVVASKGAPEWEQVLSAGAATYNLCLAANALGFGTCWLTEWYSYSPLVRERLQLGDAERLTGFVYIGTTREPQPDRERPELSSITTRWTG
jgi:nitroreductase